MLLGDTQGDGRWFSSGSGGALGLWMSAFGQAIATNSAEGLFISSSEAQTLLELPLPNTVSTADAQNAIDRWNLSVTNWNLGVFSPTNVPTGGNTNFINFYDLGDVMSTVGVQYQAALAAGYADPIAGFFAALINAESKLGGGGVCAQVVLQIGQSAVLTRDAFSASLQLQNAGASPLGNVSVNLVVRNASGQDVTAAFGVYPPTVTGGLSAVDGTGNLAPGSSASAQWTLVPSLDAAPQAPTNYLVSGTFSYTLNGVTITIPLSPAPISVQPNPQLYLKYSLSAMSSATTPTRRRLSLLYLSRWGSWLKIAATAPPLTSGSPRRSPLSWITKKAC